MLRALRGSLRPLAADAVAGGLALATFLLGALAARLGVAMALFGDGDLALQRRDIGALVGHEAGELGALRFGRGACHVRDIALVLGVHHPPLGDRHAVAQLGDARLELPQFVLPRRHLARREGQLDGEPPSRELGVSLGTLPLARQRAHLRLHLADQVVEARQVDRRFLETAFRAPPSVAVEADAGGFLEQLAALIRAVGEQRVDHPRLDHDTRVRTQARATYKVVDVAQPARRAIQEVFALSGTREPARNDDFLERDRQRAVVVGEKERDLGDVHGAPRR